MKQIIPILLSLSLFSIVHLHAQQDTTVFFSKTGAPVSSRSNADRYQGLSWSGDTLFTLTSHFLREGKWLETEQSDFYPLGNYSYLVVRKTVSGFTDSTYWQVQPVDTGFVISEFRKNILTSRGFSRLVAPLLKEGLWIYYMPEYGGLDRDETFRNNELGEIRYWDEDTDTFITDVFTLPESGAEFEGGDEALYQFLVTQMVYPEKAKEKKEQGRVFVSFIVMEDGSLKRIRVIHGVSPSIDSEALRVVNLSNGKWKPARNKGEAVRVLYNFPIRFTLE